MLIFKRVLILIAVVGLFFLIGKGLSKALERGEIVECQKLQQQAGEFEDFFITQWQDEQCRSHDIRIDTKVIEISEIK